MKIPLMVLALTTGMLLPVSAAAQTGFSGAGTASCGDFARVYRLSPETAEYLFVSWAQGFLSGLNAAAVERALDVIPEATPDDARISGAFKLHPPGMDQDGWFRHLRQFCDRRPLAMFYEAVFDLRETLIQYESE